MNQTSRNASIGVIALIVLVLLAYFAWKERGGSQVPSTTATSTGISINVGTSTEASSTGGYIVTPIYATTTPAAAQAPNYKTPLTSSAGISADLWASAEALFATIQTTLASTPKDWGSWITLGALRKETGDYQGATADWKYVTKLYPTDPTAYADLGDLYANYLNQPTQGEAYYKQAIALDPTQEEAFYQNLAQIYIAQGDTADAKATLQQGISAQVVGYQNLQTELNSMQ